MGDGRRRATLRGVSSICRRHGGETTDLIKVATVHDPGTAAVVKSMLESAGIPVLLQSEHAAISLLLFAGTGGGPGPVDIMVPADCAADATALLATAEPDEPRT